MSESAVLDFKPRARGMVIGAIPWLARISDKARASLATRIGDYVYPCPADQKFLDEMGLSADDFTRMVADSATDDDLVARMQAHLATRANSR